MSSDGSPQADDTNKLFRVVELYCGIGGCAAALQATSGDPARGHSRATTQTIAAIDINRGALNVYAYNYPHPTFPALLEFLRLERLRRWDAHLWWMSPPCQPFTQRGHQRDLDDPRTKTFLAVIDHIAAVRPRYVALENVPPFRESRVRRHLIETLEESGYTSLHECLLCPSDFGIPNRRQRYYLVAGRGPLLPFPTPRHRSRPLATYLDSASSPDLEVDPELIERYGHSLHLVRANDPDAVTHCFTSAYGRSPVRSGSYLEHATGVRRFSPGEILRLLGFPPSYQLPPDLPLANAWRLVGNSLSITPVQSVLAAIPELAGLETQK